MSSTCDTDGTARGWWRPSWRWQWRWLWLAPAAVAASSLVVLLAPTAGNDATQDVLSVRPVENPDTARPPSSAYLAVSPVIGMSAEVRPIEAFEVGDGDTVIAVVGGIHTGPEAETVDLVRLLLDHFQTSGVPPGIRLVFVPLANPDGLAADTRVNAHLVDLNRNWSASDWTSSATHSGEQASGGDAPLSEPETRALHDLLIALQPAFTLSYHAFAGVVDDNGVGAAQALAKVYADAAGYEQIATWTEYQLTGQMIDSLAEARLPAADVELIEDDISALDRNINALEAVIQTVAQQ